MKITGIAVEGVGKFGLRREVTGFGPGVNILAAPNEAGKSTLFRAVRACLFDRHDAKHAGIRSLVSDGLSLPVAITLSFEQGGQSFVISKTFLNGASASLSCDGTQIAKGRAADEQVWEILGVAPGSGGLGEGAFGLLWVGQGESLKPLEPKPTAVDALTSAIRQEVGELVGGERAKDVVSRIDRELGLSLTAKGNEFKSGLLATARARLADAESELASAANRLAQLDAQLGDLAEKQTELARHSDPAAMAEMRKERENARLRLEAGVAAASALQVAESAEQASRARRERCEERCKELAVRAARIDANRMQISKLEAALAPLERQRAEAQSRIQALREEAKALETETAMQDKAEHLLRRLVAASRQAEQLEELRARCRMIEALSERLVANRAALAAHPVTDRLVQDFVEATRGIAALTALLEAGAPQVSVTLGSDALGDVRIGTETIRGDTLRAATEPLTITVGRLATVIVKPQAAETDGMAKREALRRRTHDILVKCGVKDAAALHAARAERDGIEREERALEAEMKILGLSGSPAAAIEKLKGQILAAEAEVDAALSLAQADDFPDPDSLSTKQDEAQSARAGLAARRARHDADLAGASDGIAALANEHGRLHGALSEVKERLDADLGALPQDTRDATIAAAADQLAHAKAEHDAKAVAAADQRRRTPDESQMESLRHRFERMDESLERHRRKGEALNQAIANLEGRIEAAGGEGLGDRAEVMRQEHDLAQRDVTRQAERVAMLQLLKATIEACQAEQREKLYAPLKRHLKPFLGDVFPAADIDLGDGFTIAGMTRSNGTEVFERLSGGTQEQIAVLVRLAMGALICERGEAVPILLDDPLAYSDAERIQCMFDAFTRAGRQQQVIIFTCRDRAFAHLGGNELVISG